jgi:hypothetical protein
MDNELIIFLKDLYVDRDFFYSKLKKFENRNKIIKNYIEIQYDNIVYFKNDNNTIKVNRIEIINEGIKDNLGIYRIIKKRKINPVDFPSSHNYSKEFIINSIIYKIDNASTYINFNKIKSNNNELLYQIYINSKNINQSEEQIFQNIDSI